MLSQRRNHVSFSLLSALMLATPLPAATWSADSVTDFSLSSGLQGKGGWHYGFAYHGTKRFFGGGYLQAGSFIPFPENDGAGISVTDFWADTYWDWGGPGGNPPWTTIGNDIQCPNTDQEVVRRYVVPSDSLVNITYTVADAQTGGGNGIIGQVYANGELLASHDIAADDTIGITNTLSGIPLRAGSLIDFVVDAKSYNDSWDYTISKVALIPEPTMAALAGMLGALALLRRRYSG